LNHLNKNKAGLVKKKGWYLFSF